MKINKVTITGADNSILPEDLIPLSVKFPFVEWAVLLSETKENNPRFPSRTWIDELALLGKTHNLKLAGHICGSWVRNLVVKKDPAVFLDRPEFLEYFPRIQLNFSPYDAAQLFLEILKPFNNEFIIQMGKNRRADKAALVHFGRNMGINLSVLFDESGGHGVIPASWPDPLDLSLASVPLGYAGGLGPDTLAEQLPKIEEAVGDRTIWIDMESRVRSEDDNQFDLDKVRACLEICSPWIVK